MTAHRCGCTYCPHRHYHPYTNSMRWLTDYMDNALFLLFSYSTHLSSTKSLSKQIWKPRLVCLGDLAGALWHIFEDHRVKHRLDDMSFQKQSNGSIKIALISLTETQNWKKFKQIASICLEKLFINQILSITTRLYEVKTSCLFDILNRGILQKCLIKHIADSDTNLFLLINIVSF